MTYTIYSMLNVASAVLIGGLGAVIAAVRIPARTQTRHYRTARTYLSVSFILLALLKLTEIIVPKDNDTELTGCIALIVGALQALCFTASLLLFIRPQWVTRRRVATQLVGIAAVSLALVACQTLLPSGVYHIVMAGCSALYVALLVYYTLVFRRAYQQFGADMTAYYQEEDLNRQLRWIAYTFYSSLAVGCLVFLSVSGIVWLDCLFIVIYSAFYVYLTSRFINYGQYVSTVMRAVQPDEQSQVPALGMAAAAPERMSRTMVKAVEDTPMKFVPISARLQQWVDERRYLQSDVAVKDVAAALDTSPRRLNEYFSEVVGEDFVKWRMRMRLQYACQLIDQNPDRAMQEIAVESGFGDRSYFYRKFSEVMGMTVTQYKQQAKLQLTRTSHDYSGNE